MTRLAIVLLVLLRLTIGWHLFYEGYKKLQKGTFTSEDYLRESVGPLAPVFRDLAGDPLADRLTPKALPADTDPTKVDLSKSFPAALELEWDAWFARFVKHYDLSDEQKKEAETKLQQKKSSFVEWLRTHKRRIEKTSPYGPPVVQELTVSERIAAYRAKHEELRAYLAKEYRTSQGTLFEDDAKVQAASLRREFSGLRNDLKAELAEQGVEMRAALMEAAQLTPQQLDRPALPTTVKPGLFQRSFLGWIDVLVPWGLLLMGGCLMLGLGTRVMAVGAALLLLSFYVAMPPLPGLPEPPQSEGNYLVINKNLVEVVALLLLAATASGRWFGLDGALRLLCCCRGVKKPAPTPTQQPTVA